ncbi:AbrB/MazE/SpoVT family DNA-binding domain-containing protein [Paenibacillus macquariensis]|nr:AbrB/MazE/SpoVT family DNA-binding domain-containing protein [Paenibacillus macquariensis]MEC0089889.1 AbrB/MazE/SpoVT family DNA-binding domain-containing protein [Paenibacillus macquariensis]
MTEIEIMDNGQRIKLLGLLYDKHFNNSGRTWEEVQEERYLKIEAESEPIDTDGQVTIPIEIRTKLNLNTGDTVLFQFQFGRCYVVKTEDSLD